MVHRQTLFTGRRDRLAGQLWTGRGEAIGAALVVHGLGDHSGSFEPLAHSLAQQDFATFAFDLPGHGQSPGDRGRADTFDGLLKDIGAAQATLRQRFPELPLFLVGHSMGGNLALNYTLRQTLDRADGVPNGLILCAPMLLPPTPPPRPYIFAAWLTGHLFPWIRIERPVDPLDLTTDPTQAEVIRTDPLRHSQITIYLATQLLSQGRWALDQARHVTIPTLVLLGDDDPLIDRSACEHLAIRMGEDATIVRYPGMRHDLFHDPGTTEVLETLGLWTAKRVT